MQVGRERLEVGHGADPRVHGVIVLDRVAAIVFPVARLEQRHQVQIRDAELGQVIQMLPDASQRARESVRVADVADHAGALEPRGIDLAAAVKHPQCRRASGGRFQRVKHECRHEAGHVHDIAIELLKRLGYVKGQLFQARQEGVGLLRAKPLPRG
jgi:hypothetical protein